MPSSRRCDFDVSAAVDLPGPTTLAAELFDTPAEVGTLLVSYPGGGNNRRYFDLDTSDDHSFSFAQSMAGRGWPTLIVDHLGIGDSTRPDNGYDVTIERVIAAHHALIGQLRAQNRWQRVIAVGHSMGAMLAIFQQARYSSFDAMALLGFGVAGLPDALNVDARAIATDPIVARQRAEEIARLTFDSGYFELPAKSIEAMGRGNAALGETCARAIAPIIAIGSAMSLVPNIAAREMAQIDVPVLVANGDRDLAGSTEQFGDAFARAPAVTAVPLDDCGHNHFLYDARHVLYDALDNWLRALT